MTLEEVIIFAARKHKKQFDKEGEPYILHLLRVMGRMNTKEEQIVAVLHDILEDTKTTTKELYSLGLDRKLIKAIEAITKMEGEGYPEFIDRLKKNRIAKAVKFADITDNLDPKRLQGLPVNIRKRLMNKYQGALKRLRSQPK